MLLAIERSCARTFLALGAGPAVVTGTVAEWPIATGLVTIRASTARLVAKGTVATRRAIPDRALTTGTLGAGFALERFRAGTVTTLRPRATFAAGTIAERPLATGLVAKGTVTTGLIAERTVATGAI